jgi:cytochrome c biogenesis protein
VTTTDSDAPAAPGSSVALSTQPLPPPPPQLGRRSPWQIARRGWRLLTSMRTALLLLVLLGLAAIPGSLIPQHSLAPSTVLKFQQKHPTLSKVYDKFDLFDVFHAPWFAAIYLLLFVSLVGCVIPRTRLHLRAMLRKPPSAPRNLGRLPQSARWETDLPPDRAVELAAKALRRRRFRVAVGDGTVAAEKGYLRETGNLLFHLSLILLLAGIGTGSLFGYTGSVLLVDGHSFTNVAALYDTYKPGALTNSTSLSPFSVHLNGFDATYQADGEPETFDAHVTQTTAGGVTTSHDLRVNHPLTFGHARVYLIGHGYTLHVVLRNKAGQVEYENDVPCIPQDLTDYLSDCVVKAPNTGGMIPTTFTDPQTGQTATVSEPLQFAFLLDFVPTAEISLTGGILSTYPAPRRPRVVVSAYTGDLGLGTGVPQSVYDVDTAALNPVTLKPSQQVITPGGTDQTVNLPQGYTLDVSGYGQWASLQVKDDPSKLYTLIAAGLIVLGLLLSLRVRRRRVWLRATPSASGRTIVEAGGLARTDADDFAREFPRLVARLAGDVRPSESS